MREISAGSEFKGLVREEGWALYSARASSTGHTQALGRFPPCLTHPAGAQAADPGVAESLTRALQWSRGHSFTRKTENEAWDGVMRVLLQMLIIC